MCIQMGVWYVCVQFKYVYICVCLHVFICRMSMCVVWYVYMSVAWYVCVCGHVVVSEVHRVKLNM